MTEERTIQDQNSSNHAPTEEEIRTAKEVIKSFYLALKNSALYPEGHYALEKTLTNVHSKLDTFFKNFGNIRLTVEKEDLLYCSEVIHNDETDGEKIAFPLFRDGIRWIEFQEGFDQEEASHLFKIINQYRMLVKETEGDIVTALFQCNFSHLLYEAEDTLWEGVPLIDFTSSSLTSTAQRGKESDLSEENGGYAEGREEGEEEEDTVLEQQVKEVLPLSIADPKRDRSLWEITPEESEELRKMVLHEENWNATGDVLDVLLVILEAQNSEEDFTAVLDFTREELQDTLVQGEFHLANNLLMKLLILSKTNDAQEIWLPSLIENFFQDISCQEFLGPLAQTIPALDSTNHDLIKVLRQTLLLLLPKAILAIGPILLQVKSTTVQKILMEVIGTLANRNIDSLVKLLNQAEEKLAEKLVFILGHLKGDKPTQVLNKMILHSSTLVRSEALNALIKRDPKVVNNLFSLIDDPLPSTRNSFLYCLGQHRSTSSENRLLLYMKQKQFLKEEHPHILACYKALGGCGSSKSIPFLKDILLGHSLNTFLGFGKLIHRQGAADALLSLKSEKARAILLKGTQSNNSVIQQAVKKAVEGKKRG